MDQKRHISSNRMIPGAFALIMLSVLLACREKRQATETSARHSEFVPITAEEVMSSRHFVLEFTTKNGVHCYTRPVTNYSALDARWRDFDFVYGESSEAIFLVPIRDYKITKLSEKGLSEFERNTWKTVDEGFVFTVPRTWKKQDVQGIDSHVGEYIGENARLDFDLTDFSAEVPPEGRADIAQLKEKFENPDLLDVGEEVWLLDGKLARVHLDFTELAERKVRNHPNRPFHVAYMHIPYPRTSANLHVTIQYEKRELPLVRKALKSFRWSY